MRKLYISDTHFFHGNILKFDNRPYHDMNEMLDDMKRRWNQSVTNADHVYIAGDFVWRMGPEAERFLRGLNGNLHLIVGNHDRFIKSKNFAKRFEEIVLYKKMTDTDGVSERPVIISHYYIPFYDTHYYNGVLIHGHSHATAEAVFEWRITEELKTAGFKMAVYNVGCMLPYMNYAPQTLEAIIKGYDKWVEQNRREDN